MNRRFDVCVVGSFMTDLIAYAPRRPAPGETLRGTDFVIDVGGKGFNQAVAAARLGAATAFVGRIGADTFGDTFRDALAAAGIDDTWVIADPDHGTGVGLPVVDADGQNSIIIVPRANDAVDDAHVEQATDIIAASTVLLLQLELPIAAAITAARIARAAGTIVVLNPAPYHPIPDTLLADVDVLVPNEGEAAALATELGIPASTTPSMLARALRERTGCDIAITLGGDGIVLATADGEQLLPAYTVNVVDTVGAGDTFCGALGTELAAGLPLAAASGLAQAAAALAVTARGGAAATPSRAQVEAFLRASA